MKYNNKIIKKVYTDVLKVVEKHCDNEWLQDSEFSDIRDIRDKAKNHLLLVDWSEKYGIDITHNKTFYGRNYVELREYINICYFKNAEQEKEQGNGLYISWSDDGRQPNEEWLLNIKFPTGAYIFGSDYPTHIFKDFFQELKKYNPKYTDTANKSLYFSLDNAGKVYNDFQSILNKYNEKNKEDYKKRRIQKMKEDLAKLELETKL